MIGQGETVRSCQRFHSKSLKAFLYAGGMRDVHIFIGQLMRGSLKCLQNVSNYHFALQTWPLNENP